MFRVVVKKTLTDKSELYGEYNIIEPAEQAFNKAKNSKMYSISLYNNKKLLRQLKDGNTL